MTDMQPFSFEGHNIRTFTIDDKAWFAFDDVCRTLEIANPHVAARRIDSEDRFSKPVPGNPGEPDILLLLVNESGLYDAIFDSRKPAAKRFRRWVTSDVIPQIRKTGMYIDEMDLPRALRQYADAVEEKMKAEKLALEAQVYIEKTRPAVTEWQTYMDSAGTCSLAELAQALGGGRTRLVARLRELGILVSQAASQGGTRPMQQYADAGWFVVKMEATNVGPVAVSYATPKGVSGTLRALVKYGVGERAWKRLPSEEDLFAALNFRDN